MVFLCERNGPERQHPGRVYSNLPFFKKKLHPERHVKLRRKNVTTKQSGTFGQPYHYPYFYHMKLIKQMCKLMVGKQIRLIRSDYICPIDQVPVTHYRTVCETIDIDPIYEIDIKYYRKKTIENLIS
jgi:hypothetical protein